ncbi:MAG: glycosyltransferase family 2 protein [Candidatus Omnitrophica bacterium]|nr:glycosyltransferase family 2 protein [Candidatus Omnitrophota bacterium]
MNKTRCDIVIPVWNMRDLTAQCIDSIIENTRFPYRIIIVDNASGEETRTYLEGISRRRDVDILIIRNEENVGNSKGANQGIRASDAEYVCILDNDTIVTENWLTEMVGVAEKDEKIGIVNPLSNFGSKRPFGKEWKDIAADLYKRNKGSYTETAAAIGFCFLIKRKVIEKIGVWPEDYGPGYFEDTEYSITAIENGFKIAIAQGSYVVHLEHSSFKKTGYFDDLFKKNQDIFYEKYGRSKRFLYIFKGKNSFDLNRRAYDEAQKRNWTWVFMPKSVDLKLPSHAYIKKVHMPNLFFDANCIVRILKKKKRFDVIYSDSPELAKSLKWFRPLHRAEVVNG